MKYWPVKPPAQVADYRFDIVLQEGESIASATVTATGVTIDDSDVSGDSVIVWLSGGEQGTVALVTAVIVTDSVPPRTFAETVALPIGGCAVSLTRAKQHLRVEHDDEDELIGAYLAAAVEQVEAMTDKRLTPKVERQVAAGFPAAGGIRLHRGPVSEVIAIAYDPSTGSGQVVDEEELADFRLVEGVPAQVLPAAGAAFPATFAGAGTVRIDYLAGYAPGEMPRGLETAVLLLTAHYYANRESVVTGTIATEVPMGVRALVQPHRRVGLA